MAKSGPAFCENRVHRDSYLVDSGLHYQQKHGAGSADRLTVKTPDKT